MERIRLRQENANHAVASIGPVTLVFSYGTLVGLVASRDGDKPAIKAVYRYPSKTTSKHLGESGLGRNATVDVECENEAELTALALKALAERLKGEG